MSERVQATYLIETAHPLHKAAEIMAGEQSTGTFVVVSGETPELAARYGARVERVTEVDEVATPSLPGSRPPKVFTAYKRAEVVLSFPLETLGTSLTGLWTAVAGNLFELSPFSGLKLTGLSLPDEVLKGQPGPQFGVAGTRQLAGVENGPLIGTIIKPSVGLSPTETAALVAQLCDAGLDLIKDDELQSDSPHSPFEARVAAVMRIVNDHREKTGKQPMVAFNLTGDPETMLRRHDFVLAQGGSCVMVNLFAVGLAGVQHVRKHAALPIHGHRAGWGMLSRHPLLGMDYGAAATFFRLAGADHLHVNGLRNKFCESDLSVVASAKSCLTPLSDDHPAVVMPVFSSGQWAGQIPDTFEALQSSDFIYLAGGGIMAHPGGPAEGVTSLKQAWEAARQGVTLETYAQSHPALKRALERFGPS